MKLVPFIIFIIIVINVLRRIAEFQRNRPGAGGNWDEGSSPDEVQPPASGSVPRAPAGPVPRPLPAPSDRVREILEQLAKADRTMASPLPPPMVRPAPPPEPQEVPMRLQPVSRRYLSEVAPEEVPEAEPRAEEGEVPVRAAAFAGSHVYRESLAKAFPPSPVAGREVWSRQRAPYVLQVRGRQSLRRAMVLAEVLGPPRAFDV